jgi:hypothetical protein
VLRKSENLIIDYFEMCYTEPPTETYSYIEDKYRELAEIYGASVVNNVIEALSGHMLSDDKEEYMKTIKKLKKETIFEISAQICFLGGMAYVEMERLKC